MVLNNYMASYYQQQDPHSIHPSSAYHHNVQNHSSGQTGPGIDLTPDQRNQHYLSRSTFHRPDVSRDTWAQQASLNATQAAGALSHMGEMSTRRPSDTASSNSNGVASLIEGNPINRQSATITYDYYQPRQQHVDLSSSNRQSETHFSHVMSGRNATAQDQHDRQQRNFAATSLATISNNTHSSESPAQTGLSTNNLSRGFQTEIVSHANLVHSRQLNNDSHTARPSNGYTGNQAASATRTLPPVTGVDRRFTNGHASNDNNQRTGQTYANGDNGQRSATVDPTDVYDPWQEYQRRQVAAQEAAERARKEEVLREEQERRRIEAELMRTEHKAMMQRDGNHSSSSVGFNQVDESLQLIGAMRSRERSNLSKTPVSGQSSNMAVSNKEQVEAEVKAMMTKLRELSSKDPTLLAQIWDQERKAQSGKVKEGNTGSHEVSNSFSIAPSKGTQLHVTSNSMLAADQRFRSASRSSTPHVQRISNNPVNLEDDFQKQKCTEKLKKPLSRGTEWPPEKKVHVAAAASDYLNSYPGNENKRITTQEISTLLDSNPSYIELCEILEARGFVIARGVLARALLSAVPDINSSAATAQPSISGNGSHHKTTNGDNLKCPDSTSSRTNTDPVNAGTRHSTSTSDLKGKHTQRIIESGNLVDPLLQGVSEPHGSARSKAGSAANLSHKVKNTAHASQNVTKATSKEEAARKRDFAEIVDLSLLSDEECGPPAKKVVTENNQQPSHVDKLASQDLGTLQAVHDFLHPTPNPSGPNENGSMKLQPKIGVDNKFRNLVIANDIDETKALRRTSYNVTTIARDVLLATGKHPEMARLNGHLEPLLTTFRNLSCTSDLNTLRWDIIDPGNPLPDTSAYSGYNGSSGDEEEDQPILASHMLTATNVGESTFTQRLDTRGPTNVGKPVFKRWRGRPPRSNHPGNQSRPGGHDEGCQPNTFGASTPTSGDPDRIPTRTPESVATSGSGGNSSNTRSSGYAAFRQAMAADGTPLPRKKGRPVGWRKYPATASSTPGSAQDPGSAHKPSNLRHSQTAGEKHKGAIQKDSNSSPSHEPQFRVYKCLWQRCAAELHNLDTLCKHVNKIHCKPNSNGVYDCRWATCGKTIRDTDSTTGEETERTEYLSYSRIDEIESHIEKAHLSVVAWSLGDGPAAGLSGKTTCRSFNYETY